MILCQMCEHILAMSKGGEMTPSIPLPLLALKILCDAIDYQNFFIQQTCDSWPDDA